MNELEIVLCSFDLLVDELGARDEAKLVNLFRCGQIDIVHLQALKFFFQSIDLSLELRPPNDW